MHRPTVLILVFSSRGPGLGFEPQICAWCFNYDWKKKYHQKSNNNNNLYIVNQRKNAYKEWKAKIGNTESNSIKMFVQCASHLHQSHIQNMLCSITKICTKGYSIIPAIWYLMLDFNLRIIHVLPPQTWIFHKSSQQKITGIQVPKQSQAV